jgi:hypothetical protein
MGVMLLKKHKHNDKQEVKDRFFVKIKVGWQIIRGLRVGLEERLGIRQQTTREKGGGG